MDLVDIEITPGSGDLDYRVPLPRRDNLIIHGCQIIYKDPLNKKKLPSKINVFGICENKWFPWQPITDSRMGVC